MRTALAILFAAVLSPAKGGALVDFYLDMEAGTNGEVITTNLLNACTHVAPGAGIGHLIVAAEGVHELLGGTTQRHGLQRADKRGDQRCEHRSA